MKKTEPKLFRYSKMTKQNIRFWLLLFGLLTLSVMIVFANVHDYKGNQLNRAKNYHSGNKVSTVFYNYGLVGNVGEVTGEWPQGTGNYYVGDVTPLVGIEFIHPSNDTMRSVITSTGPRGNDDIGDLGFMGWEPLQGFNAETVAGGDPLVAMSHQDETWPSFWPDKMFNDTLDILWQADEVDAGWPGQWNGFFGKDVTNADQESFFIMDDSRDTEWFMRTYKYWDPDANNGLGALVDTLVWDEDLQDTVKVPTYFYPIESDTLNRYGLGIRVAVRGFQWSHFLAEDACIWHYEIANVSDRNYDKVVFGMVVGTLAGGRQDSEDDLAFFDPENDITYSWDSDDIGSAGWVPVRPGEINVGYAGYAFLESPGNSFDGIDNDNDSPNDSPVLNPLILDQMTNTGLTYSAGSEVIMIDYDGNGIDDDGDGVIDNLFERSIVTMPSDGTLEYTFAGVDCTVYANNPYVEIDYNNFDDNFNGLIDERLGEVINGKRLDHVGLKYKNFFTGEGVDDPMIDEARDDGIDNDGDWDVNTDDVGFDGQAGTGDTGEQDGEPTLGEPNFDKTDINESDQIGLTSFEYFSPPGAVRMNSDDGLWDRMRPGLVDVVSQDPEDGDFVYGSGYFPLPRGKTERFSIALFFGEDLQDITLNKITVQQIYDNNYNFARPPDKPTVKAVPGDGVVTLYWDDAAESSFDPSMPEGYENDFEGYKIYRATDAGFLENFVITDGLGRTVFHKPIAQFDYDNSHVGFFEKSINGISFYLGENTGLQHVWKDTTVENGQTYYYAVTSYDRGFDGVVDLDTIVYFPAECPKIISVSANGDKNYDINSLVVTPGVNAAGYVPPVAGAAAQIAGQSSGLIYTEVIDRRLIDTTRTYHVSFTRDSLENQADRYQIWAFDAQGDSFAVIPNGDLLNVGEERRVQDLFDAYFDSVYALPSGSYNTWVYYRTIETDVFNGLRAYLLQPRIPGKLNEIASRWYSSNSYGPDSLLNFTYSLISFPSREYFGSERYADYRFVFHDEIVDTSVAFTFVGERGSTTISSVYPINFTVENLSREDNPLVVFTRPGPADSVVWDRSVIMLLDTLRTDDGALDTVGTWSFSFSKSETEGINKSPMDGDTLMIRTYKPFNTDDLYEFSAESARIEKEEVVLSDIRVYPNPYFGVNKQEPANRYSSGRGERRITFIHLPDKCTIRIYTIRGELVKKIQHDSGMFDGSENWDLRSDEGLDVAYGIYIYHVESLYGDHTGKFALIK